ncbi:hypothetical protein TeGR_g12744, partial [Tetraparma gracilis]
PPPPLLEDRSRNGVLLCDLARLLEPALHKRFGLEQLSCRCPTAAAEASLNTRLALHVFRLGKRRVSPRLLCDAPALLGGEGDVFAALCYELLQLYPAGAGEGAGGYDEVAGRSGWLKYGAADRRRAGAAAVEWLAELGVLNKLGLWDAEEPARSDYARTRATVTGELSAAKPEIFDLAPHLFDGTLFCQLGEAVLDGARRGALRGWSRRPGTAALVRANLDKVVTAFKGWYNVEKGAAMSTRCMGEGVQERVMAGDWVSVLGILEDAFRCADGMKPGRANAPPGQELPYYGKYVGVYGSGWREKVKREERRLQEEEKKEEGRLDLFCNEERGGGGGGVGGVEPALPEFGSRVDLEPMSDRAFVQEYVDSEIVPTDETRSGGHPFVRNVVSRDAMHVRVDGNDIGPVVVEEDEEEEEEEEEEKAEGGGAIREGEEADKHFEEAQRVNGEDAVNMSIEQALGLEGEVAQEEVAVKETVVPIPESPFPIPSRHQVVELRKWLRTKLNVKLKDAKALLAPPYVSEEFKNGLLLVRIAHTLMPGRNEEIRGVNYNPKTRAACSANCRKAAAQLLECYRPAKAAGVVGPLLRNCHERIAEGDARAVVALLITIKELQ